MSSIVSVIKTKPDTILDDIKRLMKMADYKKFLSSDKEIGLKINISWHFYYPACSTTPWQIEGVIKTLLDDNYQKEKIYACQNKTVVVSAKKGEINNKHKLAVEK